MSIPMRSIRCCWTFDIHEPAQKAKFGGEMFVANSSAAHDGTRFLDFFQIDKNTGDAKGIVAIDLGAL